jgi:hypothetical protein
VLVLKAPYQPHALLALSTVAVAELPEGLFHKQPTRRATLERP